MGPGADAFTSQPQPAEERGKARNKQCCCVWSSFTRNHAALNFNWVVFELGSLKNLAVLIQHAHPLHPVSFRIKINRKSILLLALTWLNFCNKAAGPTHSTAVTVTHLIGYHTLAVVWWVMKTRWLVSWHNAELRKNKRRSYLQYLFTIWLSQWKLTEIVRLVAATYFGNMRSKPAHYIYHFQKWVK